MQLRAVLSRYYDERVTYIDSGYPKVFKAAQKHLTRILGSKHTRKINIDEVDYYIAQRAKGHTDDRGRKMKPPSHATLRRELNTAISACNWGLAHKWLKPEDMPVIDLPAPSPVNDNNWLSKKEAAKLIRCAYEIDWRLGLAIAIGVFTGARPTRIRYLAWERVNMKSNIIDFRPHNENPDSKKRYVRVRMMLELVPYMEQAFRRRGGEGRYWVLGGTQRLEYKFKQAVKAAGLDGRKVTLNTLRHTWATWSAIDGVDLAMISRVLGSTLKTVEKRYAHHHPSYQKEATQRRFFEAGDLDLVTM